LAAIIVFPSVPLGAQWVENRGIDRGGRETGGLA
jgi:hypothetical protein